MRTLPNVPRRDEFDAVVVRTDHSDAESWQAVAAALMEPWGDEQYEPHVHVIDDPAWAEVSVDELRRALAVDEDLCVVFLADQVTMRSEHHPLLAVTLLTREECVDDEDYERLTEFGTEFRTVPAGVHGIHANLSIGNLGFEEFAAWAHDEPEGTFRDC
ncbi:DUF6924 domain-containing protein [Streptomyces sp. NPDC086010]|uniref:DUF6924 domain-containing protein n=1 Tax=Streptomyces sp. NPDC086010 TaxID=3365745 RepID=UPI0037CDA685